MAYINIQELLNSAGQDKLLATQGSTVTYDIKAEQVGMVEGANKQLIDLAITPTSELIFGTVTLIDKYEDSEYPENDKVLNTKNEKYILRLTKEAFVSLCSSKDYDDGKLISTFRSYLTPYSGKVSSVDGFNKDKARDFLANFGSSEDSSEKRDLLLNLDQYLQDAEKVSLSDYKRELNNEMKQHPTIVMSKYEYTEIRDAGRVYTEPAQVFMYGLLTLYKVLKSNNQLELLL